jgi:O-antigen biosynthesis protein WbqP
MTPKTESDSADRLTTIAPPPTWKAVMDLVGGSLLIFLLLIPMLLVGLLILVESGWPVLIRQRRIGQGGDEYLMWKFRTLPRDTPQMAKAELDHAVVRVTPLGRMLRRYSVDELPQLLNVLTGEMSLVGPRPALFTQQDLVALRAPAGVLAVKPGLTGLAQISGREDLTIDEKVALDAKYVRGMSAAQDLGILLRTIAAVIRARGSF